MKTKHQIIDEVVHLVNHHGRSHKSGGCRYRLFDKDHPGCALGQYILPNLYNDDMERRAADALDRFVKREMAEEYTCLDDILIQEYRGHHVGFWMEVQDLHDDTSFWKDGRRLSKQGITRVDALKEKYDED